MAYNSYVEQNITLIFVVPSAEGVLLADPM